MVDNMIELNKVYCMDCLDGMRQMPDNSVDLVVTDPPYGIEYKSNYGSAEYRSKLHDDIDWDGRDFDFSDYHTELWRILKDNSDMYVFGRMENYHIMSKLNGFKQVLIWFKNAGGMGDLTVPALDYEVIYYFKKGRRELNKRLGSVYEFKPVISECGSVPMGYTKMKHPTQKPTSVIMHLIKISSNEGDIVLDPFMGSGTTAIASRQIFRRFIGFERSVKYFDVIQDRLKQAPLKSFIM